MRHKVFEVEEFYLNTRSPDKAMKNGSMQKALDDFLEGEVSWGRRRCGRVCCLVGMKGEMWYKGKEDCRTFSLID